MKVIIEIRSEGRHNKVEVSISGSKEMVEKLMEKIKQMVNDEKWQID